MERIRRGGWSCQEAHRGQQLLTMEGEKAIVQFCLKPDDLGHPLRIPMVKGFAAALLPAPERQKLGIHWIDRFLR